MLQPEPTDNRMRRFVRKNLLTYLLPNLIFNTLIPYACFIHTPAVYLFEGEQNFARFLLPMAILLPFIITFDMLRKLTELAEKGGLPWFPNEKYRRKATWLRLAGWHGFLAGLPPLGLLGVLWMALPPKCSLDPLMLSLGIGLLAGAYSVLFVLLSLRKWKREAKQVAAGEIMTAIPNAPD